MGYDYEISYKKGKENVVADSLSRLPAAQLMTMTIATLDSELIAHIKQSCTADLTIQGILNRLARGETLPKFSLTQGLLYRNGKLVVGKGGELHSKIISLFHDSAYGGHSGVAVTTKRVRSLF